MSEKRQPGSLRWIAEELGISVEAVRGALNRAYYKLRKNPAAYALLRGLHGARHRTSRCMEA